MQKVIDKTTVLVYNIIVVMSEDITGYMQTYRSGHNGADSKSVCGQPHVSSNLTVCANKPLKADAFKGFIYEYLWTAKGSDSSSRRLKQVEKVFHLDILLLFHSAMATIASYR